MEVPRAFRAEYREFLWEKGFDEPDPQVLLMELASLSMEVYLKEIAWLSDFIGRISLARLQRPGALPAKTQKPRRRR